MKIVEPSVELIHCTPDPERVIERCGRACYQSSHKIAEDGSSAAAFVRMILANGHESVLEHASAGFSIITDRGVTHEIVRHRIASFSQESTRYCNYSNERFGGDLQFILPPSMSASQERIWREAMVVAEDRYTTMIYNGAPPQIARSVLPNSLKSEICMTANFREWRHFLKLRTSSKAHPQMRQIAELLRVELAKLSAACFAG